MTKTYRFWILGLLLVGVVALGFLASWNASVKPGPAEVRENVAAQSMLIYHSRARDKKNAPSAFRRDGPVIPDLPDGYTDLGRWTSEIVTFKDRYYLITYSIKPASFGWALKPYANERMAVGNYTEQGCQIGVELKPNSQVCLVELAQ